MLRMNGHAVAQDQHGTDPRADRRSERIERLCECEPAMRKRFGPEFRDEGISHDLQQCDAGRHHEERRQECREQRQPCGRDEQEAPASHNNEAENSAADVADAGQDKSGGNGKDEVPDEEAELGEHHFGVGE